MEDADSHGHSHGEDLFDLKMVMTAVIFLSSLGGVWLPRLATHIIKEPTAFLSISNAFAGGVILCVSLVHLLAEANESFEENFFENKEEPYPYINLCCVSGFFLLLVLEKGIVPAVFYSRKSEEEDSNGYEMITNNSHSHDNLFVTKEEQDTSMLMSYVLLLALSLHSIIEGFTLGLLQEVGSLIALFIAIIAHKGLAAFALGTNLVKADHELLHFSLMSLLFSLCTPIGVFMGIFLDSFLSNTGAELACDLSSGVTSGTFLYIACIDIIAVEFLAGQKRWLHLLALFFGIAFMAVVKIWT